MRFQELPIRLRIYILAHLLVLPALAYVLSGHGAFLAGWHGRVFWRDLILLLMCTIIFSILKVELTVLQGRMTLAFAIVCVAQLLHGLPVAVLCATAGALAGTLLRPSDGHGRIKRVRPPFYRIGFNIGNCLVTCLAASLSYRGVELYGPRGGMAPVLGLMVFTAIYFAINTLGVSVAISLQQSLPWLTVWEQNFLWTAPGYFASASVAAGFDWAYGKFHAWSLLFLPPLYLIYKSYLLYMDRLHLYSDKMQQDMTHIQELNQLNQAIIASLATAIDAKDSVTSSHINRVRHYAITLAKAAGVTGPELEAVATGALVHDIGKLGIPDHILSKPGKLAPEEFRRIQSHVSIGTEILSPIPFPFPVVDVVRTHHERWDGLGYPHGLREEEIPIGGRIISIVDVFDALTSDRPYRRALTFEAAIEVLKEGAGKQFDPRLVLLFEQALPESRQEIERMEAEHRERVAAASEQEERSSALAQINQAAAEMAAVADVAHALAEQETLEQITQVIVNRGLVLLPADTVVLYLQSQEDEALVATAVDGKYCEKLIGMTIQIGEGAAGWVALKGEPRVNVSAALDIARRFTPEEAMELSAATVVPLVSAQGSGESNRPESLGALAVYTTGYSVMAEHHLNVLNILAEHAAAAIQNFRRFDRQRELAHTDPLTGLANSRNLVRHLERLTFPGPVASGQWSVASDGSSPTERRDGDGSALATDHRPLATGFALIMLDLDHFKEVNDTLGHLQGDELLRRVAEQLLSVARPGDVVCRYAGDEFVLLLSPADQAEAERVAGRARDAIDSLPEIGGQVKVSTSVGVATFPEDGSDGRTLLHVADQRMYQDKFRRRHPEGTGLPEDEVVLDLAVEGVAAGRG